MSTLIFDIETVGEDWETLDETTQSILSRWIERTADSEESREAQLKDLKEGLGFSPLTGRIVAIGLYDLKRERGVVYFDSNGTDAEETTDGAYTYKPRTEKEMLEDFWEGAKKYDVFVTFNGRGFDAPFMMLRSVAHGLTPTRDLMDGRYLYQQRDAQHVDLADQLSFYGAVHRRQPLHLYCRAFGIESPKALGVSGDDVAALFNDGRYLDIAKYNARDVTATTTLYEHWKKHLSPKKIPL
jgi:DNA polymerase elongation subunit (family B)